MGGIMMALVGWLALAFTLTLDFTLKRPGPNPEDSAAQTSSLGSRENRAGPEQSCWGMTTWGNQVVSG